MTPKTNDKTRYRVILYSVFFVILSLIHFPLRNSTWQGNAELHTLMEVIATTLATTVGILALIHFYTKKDSTFLFVGTGFLGTALLDGYHAVVTSTFFAALFPSGLGSLIPWSWIASRFFLSVLLFLSWLAWRRENRLGARGKLHESVIYIGAILFTLASFLLFAFVPLPNAYLSPAPAIFPYLHYRPEEFVPAAFFLFGLAGYLHKGYWKRDDFEHWLILSLIVSFMTQAVFMSSSDHLFDGMFDVAHLFKKVTYILVLIGLLISMYQTFRQAEAERVKLAQANEELASEIGIRKQAEQTLRVRAAQLETITRLTERFISVRGLEALLAEVVNQIKDTFDYYHAHIYVLDDKREKLVVAAGTGIAGVEMKAKGHSISLATPTSLVARAARSGQIVRVDNVREVEDWLPNPLLPDTRSEIAVPIVLEGQVAGVLDVQSDKVAGLDEGDANLLNALANQTAVALHNARLFSEVETALVQAQAIQTRYVEQAWDKTKITAQQGQYHFARLDAPALDEGDLANAKRQAQAQNQPAIVTFKASEHEPAPSHPSTSIVAPVSLRDTVIGMLQLYPASPGQAWIERDLVIVQAISEELAQTAENLRLFDETRQRAGREATIREITDKLRAAPNLERLITLATEELGRRLSATHAELELGLEPEQPLAGNGHKAQN